MFLYRRSTVPTSLVHVNKHVKTRSYATTLMPYNNCRMRVIIITVYLKLEYLGIYCLD